MSAALEVRDLVVELGGRRVLDRVGLSVGPGEWTSIVGPNGAGKTTLLNAIAGAAPVTHGTITLLGTEVSDLSVRARARAVALVPQVPVIPEGVTALDYVLLGRTPHLPLFGRERQADVDLAADLLRRLGVGEFVSRRIETLSGGERQRVVLTRALVQEATVVLLDEPTTALDIGHQQDVLELVDLLRTERRIAVVSTMHDLTLAGIYADELVLLDRGRVAERGRPADVLTEAHLHRHFGARVSVLAGDDGPVVVPYRLSGPEVRA